MLKIFQYQVYLQVRNETGLCSLLPFKLSSNLTTGTTIVKMGRSKTGLQKKKKKRKRKYKTNDNECGQLHSKEKKNISVHNS